MKITKSQLKQIIKEELENVLNEGPLTKGMDFKMDPRLAKDAKRLSKQPRQGTPRQLSPEEKTIKMYQKQGYRLIKKQLSNREFGDTLRLGRGDRELIDVSQKPPRFIIVVDKEIGPAGKFRPTRYRPQNFPDGLVSGGRVSGASFEEAKIVAVLSRG